MRKVLVGGCFDILHYGHVSFLKKARSLGDYLIVALESDQNVRRLKGKGRPIHSQKQRSEILKSLKFVDEVILLPEMKNDKDYENLVGKLLPEIIAVTTSDPNTNKKRAHADLFGVKIVEIPAVKTDSTSRIVEILNSSEN